MARMPGSIDNLHFCTSNPRFDGMFVNVWKSLPLAARRRMLRYFRSSTPIPFVVALTPQIDDDQHTLGIWKSGSRCFLFWSEAVERLPDTLLRTLIAHELAHCCIDAYGHSDNNDEEFARELSTTWGYDEEALDDWIVQELL